MSAYSCIIHDAINICYICFSYGNEVPELDIPILSMFFSFLNMMTCAAKVNIFNVFIVQIRKVEDLKRYTSISCGYMPIFLHSILYRVAAYAFFGVFLFYYAFIPICFILLCNICIGYIFYGQTALEGHVRKLHNTFVKTHQKKGLANAHQSLGNTPVWLNSFLGLFIPSCFSTGPLPEFVDSLTPNEYKKVLKQQAKHQKSVLKYQILVSTLTILATTGIICYLIIFTEFFKYTPNNLSFLNFYFYCGLLAVQSFISLLFVFEVDILRKYDSLLIERKDRQTSLVFKLLLSALCCLLIVALPVTVYYASAYMTLPSVYIISKTYNSTDNLVTLELARGNLINNEFSNFPVQQNSSHCSVFNASNNLQDPTGKILILDQDCISKNMQNLIDKNDIEDKFKGTSGILLLSTQMYQTTQIPWKFNILRDVTAFPIILINYFDIERVTAMSGGYIELKSDDITKSLEDETSVIYQMDCPNLPTKVNMFAREDYYIGCNGNIKKSVKIRPRCQAKGHECPEVERFEKTLANRDLFGKCNDLENRPSDNDRLKDHLYPNMMCKNLPDKWQEDDFKIGNPKVCLLNDTYIHYEKVRQFKY